MNYKELKKELNKKTKYYVKYEGIRKKEISKKTFKSGRYDNILEQNNLSGYISSKTPDGNERKIITYKKGKAIFGGFK